MSDHQPEFYPLYRPLTEEECRDLAAGRVPEWIRESCRELTDWSLQSGALSYVGMRETRQRRKA